jgi:hypothetical protein
VFEMDEGGKRLRFFNCPSHFLPDSVLDFHRRLKYYREFPGSSPSPDAQSSRFLEAWEIYETELSRLEELKAR